MDLNRRVLLSGFDLGGVCNSGFNREYNLIWHRDGGLASAEMAYAGNPEIIKRWAEFGVSNPCFEETENGLKAFLQPAFACSLEQGRGADGILRFSQHLTIGVARVQTPCCRRNI